MAVPHEVLPGMAALDAVSAAVAAIYLGIVPTPQLLTPLGAKPTFLSSFFDHFRDSPINVASHSTIPDYSNPKKILVIILAICLLRCFVIFAVWLNVKDGIRAGRIGAHSEDYSGRAIGYSAACIVSILLNLSMLNLLFQSRGAPPDSKISTVLLHMSTSSLAAEQLMISGAEWILFLLVVATNGMSSGSTVREVRVPTTAAGPAVIVASSEGQGEEVAIAEVQEPLDSEIKKKKNYGALTDSSITTNETPSAAIVGAVPVLPTTTLIDTTELSHGATESSLTNTSNLSTEADAAEQSVSSDIIDIPKDRRSSMHDAKERLFRARENGKVRRRSLWKKIRGKGRENGETESLFTS